MFEKYGIDSSKGLEFGLYTLGDHIADPATGKRVSPQERIQQFIEMATLADQAGLDVFSIGESHQEYFVSQAHAVILAAIAQATKNIRISSASTIVSTSDPVRIYENFATLDLISGGRAEIIGGRASRVGLFDLLGYDLQDYEALFEEKFALLNLINDSQGEPINWQGEYRAPLNDAVVLPEPVQNKLPIWRAVGGAPASAIKAGMQGVPMYLAGLGGPMITYKRTIDAYRDALSHSGHNPEEYPVALAGFLLIAEDSQKALRQYYPSINEGMMRTNGQGFQKRAFAQGVDPRSIMNIGSPQQIIEKILEQHELFGHQRYVGQMDFGGVPFNVIMKNIEVIGNEILPAIRKYTKPDKEDTK